MHRVPHRTNVFSFPLRVLLASIGYSTYFLSIAGFLCAGLPFFLVLSFRPERMRRAMYALLKAYAFFLTRLWLPALGIYSVHDITGLEEAALSGAIVVANHRGRLDALLMLSMLPPAAAVIKQKYARIPLYSSFVKYLDFVNIDPASLSSLGAAIEKCRTVLSRGKCLLVFPEGTRAKTGRLLPFRPLPFRVAMETGAPVVPVVIHSGLPFMARCKESIFPRRKFEYKIRFLAPLRPNAGENPSAFAERVRFVMAKEIAIIDRGTYWDSGGTRS